MPHTLLIADDSVTTQRVVQLTFAGEDVKVFAVSDGHQAIARLDADPPDIVLADAALPGRSGYEIAQYVKQTSRLSRIPVVLLTGALEPVDRARADAAGCDGVLAKPFDPQQVVARVKALLRLPHPITPNSQTADLWPRTGSGVLPPTPDPAALDLYFSKLDAAFAAMSAEPAASGPHAPANPSRELPPPLSSAAPQADFAQHRSQSDTDAAARSEIVDEVTRRVLDRLSDRVVRETVSELVASIAERLIREEIERIKSAIE